MHTKRVHVVCNDSGPRSSNTKSALRLQKSREKKRRVAANSKWKKKKQKKTLDEMANGRETSNGKG